MLAEVANCMPELTLLVIKCYGTKLAGVLFRVDSEKSRNIACSSEVQQSDPSEPVTFCMVLRLELKGFRERFEEEGIEAFVSSASTGSQPTGCLENGTQWSTRRSTSYRARPTYSRFPGWVPGESPDITTSLASPSRRVRVAIDGS